MQTRTELLEKKLENTLIEKNKLQNNLDNYINSNKINKSSNYLLNQIIPLQSKNNWLLFCGGVIGGYTLCLLLNL